MYRLVWSSKFTREARKFTSRHPELQQRFTKVLDDLTADPFQPHLRSHPLAGGLAGLYAVRLTHAVRIICTIDVDERKIGLVDIGSHDEVYG